MTMYIRKIFNPETKEEIVIYSKSKEIKICEELNIVYKFTDKDYWILRNKIKENKK